MTANSRSQQKLLLIVLLFLTPFIAAVVMRFGGWQPTSTRNFGELLAPPLSMEAVAAVRSDATPWPWVNTERHWTLLLQLPEPCASACRDAAGVLPNVRQALGRHVDKLHPFTVISANPNMGAMVDAGSFPSLQLTGELPPPLAQTPTAMPQVWLIDPHGYLVMRYREGFDPNGLRRDLSRLIK
ncbi:MAG: hypothetical protein ACT4NL_16280 [Pseudomarimonas sp.]